MPAPPAPPSVAKAAAAPTAVSAGRSPRPTGWRAPDGAAAAPTAVSAEGGDSSLPSVMCEILSAAALSAPQQGKVGFDEVHSDAIVGVTLGMRAAATKDALVGTKAGAQAKAAWQDGSPNGIGWAWVFPVRHRHCVPAQPDPGKGDVRAVHEGLFRDPDKRQVRRVRGGAGPVHAAGPLGPRDPQRQGGLDQAWRGRRRQAPCAGCPALLPLLKAPAQVAPPPVAPPALVRRGRHVRPARQIPRIPSAR